MDKDKNTLYSPLKEEYFRLQSNKCIDTVPDDQHLYEVVIIGAGISGISAGNELLKRGVHHFCILEAQSIAGGRIKTFGNKDDGYFDIGAQWVHGEAPDNAIHSAIKESYLIDTNISEIDGRGDFFSEFGQKLTDDENLVSILEFFEEMNEAIDHEHFNCCENSVGGYFNSKFQHFLSNIKTSDDLSMYYSYYNWMLRWEREDNACHSMDKLSLIGRQDYKFCRGERNMRPKKGMISVFNEIAKLLFENIHLNTEVIKVQYNERSLQSNDNVLHKHGMPVTVSCKSGKLYHCNHVIVTCSLGYLKKNLNIFCPPLPEKLEKAIQLHGYGNLGKIFLEFDTKWWDWKDGSLELIWIDNLPQFDNPTERAHHWTKGICGVDEVYGRKNTVMAWIAGDECAEMELLPIDEVALQITQLLRKFTGKFDIPTPINVYRSEFSTNKFFNGAYSHPISTNDRENIIDTLNIPVYGEFLQYEIPYLTFAGEANSKHYYSTMHGAMENGAKQASIYCDLRKRKYSAVT